jgi:hypothetical protein
MNMKKLLIAAMLAGSLGSITAPAAAQVTGDGVPNRYDARPNNPNRS